jgi:hypothetical protein
MARTIEEKQSAPKSASGAERRKGSATWCSNPRANHKKTELGRYKRRARWTNTDLKMALAHRSWAEKLAGALVLLAWAEEPATGSRTRSGFEIDEQDGGHLNLHEVRTENSVSDQKSQQAEQIHAGRERPWRQTWEARWAADELKKPIRMDLSEKRWLRQKPKPKSWVSYPNQNQNQRVGKQQHTWGAKISFFIKNHQEHNRFIEVTVLPHLIIKKKILFLAHTLKPRKWK